MKEVGRSLLFELVLYFGLVQSSGKLLLEFKRPGALPVKRYGEVERMPGFFPKVPGKVCSDGP